MLGDWLTASLDTTRGHEISAVHAWHGRLMGLAWGICAPMGILIARYLKVTPRQNWPEYLDNRFWWRSHLILQIGAWLAMLLGFGVILSARAPITPSHLHAWLGWGIVIGATAQILSGFLRGTKGGPGNPLPDGILLGDHYAMTRRRRVFESFHKGLGYVLLIGSGTAVLQGIWMLNGPRWMALILICFWATLLCLAMVLRKRRRITTYQAIWGPDPKHPGNQTDTARTD